ncbi:hypothetical protein [Shewanella acanthi]|uniref:hypothetical protein n=1 Tax=Shewanella acanthi TaxID=2864212 RepID=UPI001C65B6FB|nr:hypothetical protein [Shewanella acanthi]QYJ77872.1 hypothetical protein K0H61_12155 [Shewanella acanthi]
MTNLKSLFAVTILTLLSVNVSAAALSNGSTINAEITIDTADLQANIQAELNDTMAQMHREALQEPTLLIADDTEMNEQVLTK